MSVRLRFFAGATGYAWPYRASEDRFDLILEAIVAEDLAAGRQLADVILGCDFHDGFDDGAVRPSSFPDGAHRRFENSSEQDPFVRLDDLMVVVEALCPTWPARPPLRDAGRCRL